jgi:carbonic anhydrase
MSDQNISYCYINYFDTVKGILKNLITDNDRFVKSRDREYFESFINAQTPRATILTCSDSRIHEHAFDFTPDSDIFMVRNIGNQLHTARGSIYYGINHLNTPLFLIMGHTGCGAIQAANGDYSGLEPQIREELDTIRISKGDPNLNGVVENVHNQVDEARELFKDRIESEALVVMGTVYDFRNELRNGFGRLNIININGEKDQTAIIASPLLKDIP